MHILTLLAALPLALGAEPSTENAVKNLHPDTGNRLALKRAASLETGLASRKTGHWDWSREEQSKNCTHLDELRMYFELGSTWNSGTSHTVLLNLPGIPSPHTIGKEIGRGFSEWQDIKIHNYALGDITPEISIKVQVGRFGYNKDSIHVNSIKFRGRCANSHTWIENNRFASLDKTMEMKESSSFDKTWFSVWRDLLSLSNWVPRPACSRLKELKVGLQLADEAWAGTGQTLDLAIGYDRYVLATDPSRGQYFEKQINVASAFGSPTVALADIKSMKIHNEARDSDQFLPKEITIQGTCENLPDIKMVFKKKMGEWVGAEVVIPVDSEGWESRLA